jgi:hypothetical protein
MAAIVLDNERADDETGGRQGEHEGQPDRDVQARMTGRISGEGCDYAFTAQQS